MLRNRLYYGIKPWLPWRLRMAVRRLHARQLRDRSKNVWPIMESAGAQPEGWPGWPGDKKFAFVLTHDVEGRRGLEKCKDLMEVEKRLGFRSCFNFVPAGDYRIRREMREELIRSGFEVGVHDLYHDGSLYRSRQDFADQAPLINRYLREWKCSGFRAGFMRHHTQWQHLIEADYDSSMFDTDPFEPQPDGVNTIFPFWVAKPRFERGNIGSETIRSASDSRGSASDVDAGYAELPYTLPQDSTLFLLFRERDSEIWIKKVDWIVQKGGMVLLNTHPDYMIFDGEPRKPWEFSIRHYEEFLKHVKAHYDGSYWHALPHEVASFVREHKGVLRRRRFPAEPRSDRPERTIWIDLENTPHIPFFKPIIRELEKRGYDIVLTARDAYQTCEMATRYGFAYKRIGRHYGKNRILKLLGVFARGFQLLPFALRARPGMALNHGSRTQTFVCNLLRIPTVTIMDYEHGKDLPFVRPLWEITPEVVSGKHVACRREEHVLKYPGIKEDVYVPDFKPDASIVENLKLNGSSLIVTVRPPATEAHYHNPESEVLFECFMERVCAISGVKAVLLPRNKRQETQIRTRWPHWFSDSKVIIPEGVVDGLNLLWHSDLVVSGGGTMNREAAALGVPVYSIFRGTIGAVDHQLEAEGRLTLIKTPQDVQERIALVGRRKDFKSHTIPRDALNQIINHVEAILKAQDSH